MDNTYGSTFFGFDTFRPFLANINADPTAVGISVVDARLAGLVAPTDTSPTGFFSFNELNRSGTPVPVSLNDVRYVYNGPGAASLFGNPFGTVPRNYGVGPALNQLNLGFFKTTKVTERFKIQFRAELFNVLNHPNPGYGVAGEDSLPDTFVEDAGLFFARKDEMTLSSRRVQFALRIIF
jgi:hypothetical protein